MTNEQKSIVDENGLYAKLTSAEKRISDLEYLQNEDNGTNEPDKPNEGDDNTTEEPKAKLPVGAVVTIVILAVVAAAAIGGFVFLFLKNRKNGQCSVVSDDGENDANDNTTEEIAQEETEKAPVNDEKLETSGDSNEQ